MLIKREIDNNEKHTRKIRHIIPNNFYFIVRMRGFRRCNDASFMRCFGE